MQFFVPVLLLAACAVAFARESSTEGRKLSDGSAETFFPIFGTAPKPSFGDVHKAIFGFNADGSKLMPDAFAPAPSAAAGRRQLKAEAETFFPIFGTAPKPSFGDVHKAIFGFNADGSKLMPAALAPAPATGRRHLMQAQSETVRTFTLTASDFFGTAPKPTFSDVHKAIFGFNSDSKAMPEALTMAKAPAPAMGGRKMLEAHDETFFPIFGTAPKPSFGDVHKAIFGFNADGSKLMPAALAPAPATGRRHLMQANTETFFGTAPKPTFGDVHKAIFGFNNDSPASSETFFGTAPKPTFSDVHKAIFGFNSDSKAVPEGIASAPAPKH